MPSFQNKAYENYRINGKLYIQEEMKKHYQRLANMESTIDMSPPKSRTKYFESRKSQCKKFNSSKSPRSSRIGNVSFAQSPKTASKSNLRPKLKFQRSKSMSAASGNHFNLQSLPINPSHDATTDSDSSKIETSIQNKAQNMNASQNPKRHSMCSNKVSIINKHSFKFSLLQI